MNHAIDLAVAIAKPFRGAVTIEHNCICVHSNECIFFEAPEMPKFIELCSLASDVSILNDTLCFWF